MKKRVCIFSVFMISLCLVSCGNLSVTEESATISDAPKTEFTKEELLEDYDQLWKDLDENFMFFGVLAEKGVDIEAFREAYRDTLIERVEDLEGFTVLLRNMFRDLSGLADRGILAHLSLVEPYVYDIYTKDSYAWIYGQEPWNTLIHNPQTEAVYEKLNVSEGSVTTTKLSLPEVETAYFEDLKAVYFHFKTFDANVIERDRNLLAKYMLQYPEAEHVIIDITGNGGGSTEYWENNIVAPFGGKYEFDDYFFLKKTPLTEQFLFSNDSVELCPLSEFPEEYEIPSFAKETGMDYFWNDHSIFSFEDYEEMTVSDDVHRWILIDDGVYSAADSFTAFCWKTGWATLIGKKTSGSGEGPEPFPITLENTGLLVRFDTVTSANREGEMNVISGTTPDIKCKKGESPLETCLNLLKRTSDVN